MAPEALSQALALILDLGLPPDALRAKLDALEAGLGAKAAATLGLDGPPRATTAAAAAWLAAAGVAELPAGGAQQASKAADKEPSALVKATRAGTTGVAGTSGKPQSQPPAPAQPQPQQPAVLDGSQALQLALLLHSAPGARHAAACMVHSCQRAIAAIISALTTAATAAAAAAAPAAAGASGIAAAAPAGPQATATAAAAAAAPPRLAAWQDVRSLAASLARRQGLGHCVAAGCRALRRRLDALLGDDRDEAAVQARARARSSLMYLCLVVVVVCGHEAAVQRW